MNRLRNACIASALIALTSGAPMLASVRPAGAEVVDPVQAEEGKTVEKDEPAITGTYQGGNAGINADPDLCVNPGVGCVIVPIKVPKPKIAGETTAIRILVSWTNDQLVLNGLLATNDLDLYLYHDPPTRAEWGCEPTGDCPDPGPTSWTPTVFAQSTSNPDSVTVADPGSNLQLVVASAIGVSNGFHVAVEYLSAPSGSVFESLENGTFPTGPSENSVSNFTPFDTSVPSVFSPPPTGPSLPSFAPAAIGTDPALSGVGLNPIDKAIQDENSRLFAVSRKVEQGPTSASGLAVLLAMGVLPIVLIGVGAFVVLQRRPATLTIA